MNAQTRHTEDLSVPGGFMPVNRIPPLPRISAVILTLAALGATAPFSIVRAQSPSAPAGPVVPHSRQILYAPIAGIEDFAEWDVAIVNRSSTPMSGTLTIYSAEGNPFPPSKITLDRDETRHLDIRSLTPPEETAHTIGGISLDFTGQSMGIGAQVTISGFHGFGNIDAPVFGDMMYKSNNADAVWWEPQGAHSHLILGNSSADPVHAQVTYANGERREVDIAPHATIVQSVPHAHDVETLGQNINSVHVVGTGMAGTLRVTGWVSAPENGYLDTIRSYDPASGSEPAVYANGLHFSDGANHLIVRNLTANSITVSGTIYPIATNRPTKALAIHPVTMHAGASSELEIPAAESPESLDGAAIKLESSGPIASIVASYSDHDRANQITRSVPFKDLGDFSTLTGAYPWRLDGNFHSTIFVTNVGKSRASIGAKILPANGPEYFIDTRYLEVGETAVFDIRKLRDEQVPDSKGAKLPKDAKLGQFWWNTIFGNGTDKLIGRNEVVDRSSGISASFSCPYCNCPYSTSSAWINPLDPVVIASGIASIVATAGLTDPCNVNNPNPYTITPSSWSIYQPGYFSLTSNQPTSTMTGISQGTSNFDTPFTGIIYYFNGNNCFVESQPLLNPGGTGCVGPPSVTFSGTPVVPMGSTATITATVMPPCNTTPITLTLSTTIGSGSATFLNGATSQNITTTTALTILGTQASSTPNNIALTATATVESKKATVGSTSFSVATTNGAVPVDFMQTSVSQSTNAGLQFTYTWGSSSGKLADLSQCQVEEYITYPVQPDPTRYYWTYLPYVSNFYSPNPDTGLTPGPAKTGFLSDIHGHAGFEKPYAADHFSSQQVYQFRCPYYKANQWIPMDPLSGTIAITRAVSQNNGTWTYTITKSGSSNSGTLP
jgi:hypothetical protein